MELHNSQLLTQKASPNRTRSGVAKEDELDIEAWCGSPMALCESLAGALIPEAKHGGGTGAPQCRLQAGFALRSSLYGRLG